MVFKGEVTTLEKESRLSCGDLRRKNKAELKMACREPAVNLSPTSYTPRQLRDARIVVRC